MSDPARESQRRPEAGLRGRSRPTCRCHCRAGRRWDGGASVLKIGPGDPPTFPVESRPELCPRDGAVFRYMAADCHRKCRLGRAVAVAGAVAANPLLMSTTSWCAPSWTSRRLGPSRQIVICAGFAESSMSPAAAASFTIWSWFGLIVLAEWSSTAVLFPMRMHIGVKLSGPFKTVEKNRRRQAEIAQRLHCEARRNIPAREKRGFGTLEPLGVPATKSRCRSA